MYLRENPSSCSEQASLNQTQVQIPPYYRDLGPLTKENVTTLISSMLQVDPKKRSTISQIREAYNKYFTTCQYYSVVLTKENIIETVLKLINPRHAEKDRVSLEKLETTDINKLCDSLHEFCILQGKKGPMYFEYKQLQAIATIYGIDPNLSKKQLCAKLYEMVADKTDAAKLKNSQAILIAVASAINSNDKQKELRYVGALKDILLSGIKVDAKYIESKKSEDAKLYSTVTDPTIKEELKRKWDLINELRKILQ